EQSLQAELTSEAEEALAQAISLRAQAKPVGFGPKCAEARVQARRAEALLGRMPEEQPALGARGHGLVRGLDEEEADRRLLARVEEVRLLMAELTLQDPQFDPSRAVPEHEAALRAYGVAFGAPPVQVGAWIRQRPVGFRGQVVATLDDWLFLLP